MYVHDVFTPWALRFRVFLMYTALRAKQSENRRHGVTTLSLHIAGSHFSQEVIYWWTCACCFALCRQTPDIRPETGFFVLSTLSPRPRLLMQRVNRLAVALGIT